MCISGFGGDFNLLNFNKLKTASAMVMAAASQNAGCVNPE